MKSSVKTVADYLKEVPVERQAAIARLRELCLARLTGFQESMEYGMPSYSRASEVEVAFASQKHFIALYVLRSDVMNKYRDALDGRGVSLGKGCIRYSSPERIDLRLIEKILSDTLVSMGDIC